MKHLNAAQVVRLLTALSLVLNPLVLHPFASAATTAAAPGEPERPRFNPPTAPKRGHVLYGHLSPEGRPVHFEGARDSGGRERVFSHIGEKNGMPEFRTGTLETNGRITWDGAFHSRGPGQNIYPKYPSAGEYTTQLPRNRAPVPVGPVRQVPAGSGRSEINSPQKQYLPEFDPANRPSRMQQNLEWSREKAETLGRSIRNTVIGKEPLQDLKSFGNGAAKKATDSLKNMSAEMPKAVFAFYVALGFVAAYTLMTDHSHNPAAWDQYAQTLTDPVGYLALFGFLAGARLFYKGITTLGWNQGGYRQLPIFAGAMVAGALVSTPVAIVGGNADVQACLGFTTYKKTGSFKRDLPACDRAYAWFTTSPEDAGLVQEIAGTLVPMTANLMAAGGLFLGSLYGLQFVVNKTGLLDKLRTISVIKSPRAGNLIGNLAILTGQMVLFLGAYEISSKTFGIEKGVRQYLVADRGLFHHGYGSSLADAEKHLFTEWARVKKNNWKDPYSWDKVCVDTNRKFNLLYNCDAPDQLDLIGVINRYHKLQGAWRALQMQETLGAYEQWMRKLNNFNETVDLSYGFYKSAIAQIQNGTLSAEILKADLPTSNSDILGRDVRETWQKLYTNKLPEFLLASMACGPEIEGYSGTGWWQGTRRFIKNNVTGNTSPKEMIENSTGFGVVFNPPRITSPLPGMSDTVCEQSVSLLPRLFQDKHMVAHFPAMSQGRTVHGLHNYIAENIRPNILGREQGNNFDDWWSTQVMSQATALQDEFRKEYGEILSQTYKPAVTRKDYHWCEPGKYRDAGLEKYLMRLSRPGEACGPEALRRLSYGIFANLRDEMRLYLAMTIDLYMSNVHKMGGPLPDRGDGQPRFAESLAEYENLLVPRAAKILAQFDRFADQLAITNPADRADIDRMTDEAVQALNDFSAIVMNGRGSVSFPIYQLTWAEALLGKTTQLFKDSLSYYNILTAFDRSPNGR